MKNKITRSIIAMILVVTCFLMQACGLGRKSTGTVDGNKTQLRISVYESGFGTHWLENYAKQFEDKFKDYSFEEGKTGVQVRLDKNQINKDVLINQMESSEDALYFNNVDYYALASSGKAEDLTPYLDDPLTEFNDNQTILDKMDSEQKEYMTSYDGKYYSVPSYEMYRGISYDMALFEEKELYMAEGGGWTSGKEDDDPKAKGPDNIANTYDDGLPVTFEDFFAMMDNMLACNVTPFIVAGNSTSYATMLTDALFVNYQGDDYKLNFTFNGTAKDLISVDNGSVQKLEDLQITKHNGSKLKKSEGYYRVLEFAKKLTSENDYFYLESFTDSLSHLDAQRKFLDSRFVEGEQPIAMIIEGTYWQCEAVKAFEDLAKSYGDQYSFENRRYGFMPLPHYDAARAEHNEYKRTVATDLISLCMKKGLPEGTKNAAIKFIQFTSSNDMLKQFLLDTHYNRGLEMTLSDEQVNALPEFAKSNYNVKKNSNVIYKFSTEQFWVKYESTFLAKYNFESIIGSKTYQNPIRNFKEDANLSVDDYFNGIFAAADKDWGSYI